MDSQDILRMILQTRWSPHLSKSKSQRKTGRILLIVFERRQETLILSRVPTKYILFFLFLAHWLTYVSRRYSPGQTLGVVQDPEVRLSPAFSAIRASSPGVLR